MCQSKVKSEKEPLIHTVSYSSFSVISPASKRKVTHNVFCTQAVAALRTWSHPLVNGGAQCVSRKGRRQMKAWVTDWCKLSCPTPASVPWRCVTSSLSFLFAPTVLCVWYQGVYLWGSWICRHQHTHKKSGRIESQITRSFNTGGMTLDRTGCISARRQLSLRHTAILHKFCLGCLTDTRDKERIMISGGCFKKVVDWLSKIN